ncbi:hypothetical protein ACFWYW_14510 [Nonomuraea sp. NPDC059023]|uniref:hypothetical protein n=1 Tax=unclassified Nonomuraea TaxID=2593643 RepID=UPI003683B160
MDASTRVAAADTHGRTQRVGGSAPVVGEQSRGGSLTYVPYRAEAEEALWQAELADAGWFVRRLANQHGCSRRTDSDPPCLHPEHAKDLQACRLALIVLGVVPDDQVLPRTAMGDVSARAHTGRCPECGYVIAVRLDGMLTAHKVRDSPSSIDRCPGGGNPPEVTG